MIGDASLAYEYFANDDDYHENLGEADARVLFRWSSGFSVQASAFGGYDFTHDVGFGNLGTDIFFANQAYAAGVFAGVSDYEGSPEPNYYVGVEGVVFAGSLDIGGGAGVGTRNGFKEIWGEVKGYLDPNTSLHAGLFWEGDDDYTEYGVYGGAEHRLATMPVSLWADGFFGRFDNGFGFETDEGSVRVGASWFFDPAGTTLQDHNRLMPF